MLLARGLRMRRTCWALRGPLGRIHVLWVLRGTTTLCWMWWLRLLSHLIKDRPGAWRSLLLLMHILRRL